MWVFVTGLAESPAGVQDRAVWGAAARAQFDHAASHSKADAAAGYEFFQTRTAPLSQIGRPNGVLILSVAVRQLLTAQTVHPAGAAVLAQTEDGPRVNRGYCCMCMYAAAHGSDMIRCSKLQRFDCCMHHFLQISQQRWRCCMYGVWTPQWTAICAGCLQSCSCCSSRRQQCRPIFALTDPQTLLEHSNGFYGPQCCQP
jgi:hypothetical protein